MVGHICICAHIQALKGASGRGGSICGGAYTQVGLYTRLYDIFDTAAKFSSNTISWFYSSLKKIPLKWVEAKTFHFNNPNISPSSCWDHDWKLKSNSMNQEITVLKLLNIWACSRLILFVSNHLNIHSSCI